MGGRPFEPGFYTQIMPVRPADAIYATLELAGRHGVLAGPTTGATYWAARQYLRQQSVPASPPRRAVIIACDRLEPYLSYFRKRRPEFVPGRRGVRPRKTSRTTWWRPHPSFRSARWPG